MPKGFAAKEKLEIVLSVPIQDEAGKGNPTLATIEKISKHLEVASDESFKNRKNMIN